jgi:hypothetical protein
MMGSRTQSKYVTHRQQSSDAELEWVVAQLSDEAEHWKGRAEELEHVVEELQVELDRLQVEKEIADAWRAGIVAEANELAQSAGVEPSEGVRTMPLAGLAVALPIALVAWGALALLAYGLVRLFPA